MKRSSAIWILAILLGCDSAVPWGDFDFTVAQRARKGIVEDLAIQLAVLLQMQDKDAVQRTMNAVAERRGELLSVGIRRNSGDLYAQTPEHDRHWIPSEDGKSTITHVFAPIYAGKDVWGHVEVSFRRVVPETVPLRDVPKTTLRDDGVASAQRAREPIVAYLAVQLAVLLEKQDKDALQLTIDAISERDGEVLSIGMRRNSGDLYAQTSKHDRLWIPLKDGKSTITHAAAPLYAGKDVWGNVEVSFRPLNH